MPDNMTMNPEHIDFISSYCDRWCERCSFTHRCSASAANAAVAMCGDEHDGLELAFGRAPDDDGVPAALPAWVAEIQNEYQPMSPREEREFQRKHDESRSRRSLGEGGRIMLMTQSFTDGARAWLRDNEEALSAGDEIVREAFEVAAWDSVFILAKLHRALNGKDAFGRELDDDDDWSRKDSNGSAKIALISIVRSTEAWGVLASATGLDTPGQIAMQLKGLREAVEREFPDAWKFRRPGFDEPVSAG
jgi:hypothetical protein